MRPIIRIVRMIAGLGAWTMWVPPILLTAWSGIYLWDVFEYATAPGVPVAFEYDGPKGKVKVRAKSYALDVSGRRAMATELEVRSPANTRVIYVAHAVIEQTAQSVTRVRAHGVEAVLERMPNGEFTFNDILPKAPESQGPDAAVQVEANEVRLKVLDRTRGLVTLNGTTNRLTASGMGAGWLVNSTMRFDRIGSVPLQVLIAPESRFEVDLGLRDADAAPLLPMIERYLAKNERLPFSARLARLNGKLQLTGSAGGSMHAYGQVKVNARMVSATDFRADDLSGFFNLYGQRVSGAWKAQGSGLELDAKSFAFDWAQSPKLVAKGEVRLVSLGGIPRSWRKGVPKGVQVQGGKFVGEAGWQGSKWLANGDVSASQVLFGDERINQVGLDIVASDKNIAGRVSRAQWSGVPLHGAFVMSPVTGALNAFVQSESVNLNALARRANLPLTGRGSLKAVISSPKGKPQLWLASSGQAMVRLENGNPISGRYQAQLSGSLDRLMIDQAILTGKQGTLAATGNIDLNRKKLDLSVFGGQLSTSTLAPDTQGKAFLSGRVTGSMNHPDFKSVVDVHDLSLGDVKLPWLQLHASGNQNRIKLEQIQGQYGFSRIAGDVTYDTKTGKLSGSFNSPAIQLAEFGNGNAAGIIRVRDGKVSGTLSQPRVSAKVEGGTIFYSGATLAGLSAQVAGSNEFIQVLNGRVEVADGDQSGTVDFSGQYRLKSKTGEIAAAWENLPLRPLAQFDERFAVRGETTGSAKFALNQHGPVSGTATGSLTDVALNGELVGSGPFDARVENGQWLANGSIGSLDRFASLDSLKSDQKGNLTGTLTSYNMRAEALIRLTRLQWKDAPEDVKRFVAGLTGEVNGTLAFSNVSNEFRLTTEDLTVTDLSVNGRTVGNLSASIVREGDAWQVARVELANGAERIFGSGRMSDDGQMNFEGEANKVSLSWLNALNPDLAVIPATADASFILDGKSDNPHLIASLKVDGVPRGDSETKELPPSLTLDQIELKDHQVVASGAFQAQGFTGAVAFEGSLASILPSPHEGRQPGDGFKLEANIAERQISEFKDLLSFLDFDRSSGSLGGKITATGTIDDVKLSGGFGFGDGSGKLAFNGVKTELVNPILALALRQDKLEFTATAMGSQGGSLNANIHIPSTIPSGSLEEWLAGTPVTGEITLTDFKVDEGEASKGNQLNGVLATVARDSSAPQPIRISGNLNSPLIAGKVQVSGGSGDLPTFAPAEAGPTPPVDPRFDLEFASANPISIRTATATLIANATGAMRGSLLRPQADGTLFVDGGSLRLPNARIKLEEGGLVNFLMRTSAIGETTIEIPVTLTGRTSVSARGPSSDYQRYDIEIQVNGDLMQQGDLQLIGRSDPNDLTQEQILAIIGQRDLLEALATGTQGRSGGGDFRDAVIGLLLPTLSDRITGELAQELNLDYIALDYNPFEGAVLSAAKSFNKFVTLEARRAITEQRFVDAIQYELRLVYRVPTNNPLLSRSRFVLSTSNRAAWRISIEFSTKF